MGIKRLKKRLASERGTVAFEFILMLPIYLMMLGWTLLIFELLMGLIHLQESNRNLAWVAGDRQFSNVDSAKKMLNTEVRRYYDDRNKREAAFGSNEKYWLFGDKQDMWGVNVIAKQTGAGAFRPGTPWGFLVAGNMELRMNQISSVYLGMIALSSLHDSGDRASESYERSFDLTRTPVPRSGTAMAGDDFMPESYLYRRRGSNADRGENVSENVYSVIGEQWPTLGDDANALQLSSPSSGSSDSEPYKRVISVWAQ